MKSLSILLIVFPVLTFAYSAFSTNRHVNVVVENHTGQSGDFQIVHVGRNGDVDRSRWRPFEPKETKEIFSSLKYKTGLVWGSDRWKVFGRLSNKSSLCKTSPVDKHFGAYEYKTLWNRHTLRVDDDHKTIVIRILPNLVHYQSPSGQSFAKANNYSKKL